MHNSGVFTATQANFVLKNTEAPRWQLGRSIKDRPACWRLRIICDCLPILSNPTKGDRALSLLRIRSQKDPPSFARSLLALGSVNGLQSRSTGPAALEMLFLHKRCTNAAALSYFLDRSSSASHGASETAAQHSCRKKTTRRSADPFTNALRQFQQHNFTFNSAIHISSPSPQCKFQIINPLSLLSRELISMWLG